MSIGMARLEIRRATSVRFLCEQFMNRIFLFLLMVVAAVLSGQDQRAIGHRQATAGPLQDEAPFWVLDLGGDVCWLRPRQAVVVAVAEHELAGFVRLHAGARTIPRAVAVAPGRRDPDATSEAVY